MSEKKSKLEALREKQQALAAQIAEAQAEQKNRVGALAEKFKLINQTDEFFIGLFLDAQKAVNEDKEKVKYWEASGSSFLSSKRTKTKKPK